MEIISPEEKQRLTELEIKHSLGGTDPNEQTDLFDLRKKKKMQQVYDDNHGN